MEQPLFQRVTIVGLGQIGASLGGLLRARRVAGEVVGADVDRAHIEIAHRLGFIDRGQRDAARAVTGAQAVVLALPGEQIEPVMAAIGPDVRPGAVVCCTAGTPEHLRQKISQGVEFAGNFIPCFPLMRATGRGPASASPGCLLGKTCLVSRAEPALEPALERAQALWRRAGLVPREMPARDFETAVAGHWHWPRLVAGLARQVAERGSWPEGESPLAAWRELAPAEPDGDAALHARAISQLIEELVGELQRTGSALSSHSSSEVLP